MIYHAESDAPDVEFNISSNETPEKPESVLATQETLVRAHGIENPFYEFTDKNFGTLSYLDEETGICYKWGPVGGFPTHVISQAIRLQTDTYISQGTMGSKFPQDKTGNLEAVFCGGFSPDTTIILASCKDADGREKPIAGITIFANDSEEPLAKTVNGANVPSSICVTQSVRISALNEKQKERLKDVREKEVATPSRFWKSEDAIDPKVALNIIHLVPHAAVSVALACDRSLPKLFIYDTHLPNLVRLTTSKFGAEVLALGEEVVPTRDVLSSVLAHHYGGEELGGYKGKISIVVFDTRKFLETTRQGIDQNLSRKSGTEGNGGRRIGFTNEEIELLFGDIERESIVPSPEEFANKARPEIIDPASTSGRSRLEELRVTSAEPNVNFMQYPSLSASEMYAIYNNPDLAREIPFRIGCESIQKLAVALSKLPETKEGMDCLVKERLGSVGVEISDFDFKKIFGWVIDDLLCLRSGSLKTMENIEAESRWIYMPSSNKLTRYIGPDAHNILARSRLLGIVPFERLDELRRQKIRCIGASVANMTLHALVASGAEDIRFVDGDELSPESAQRQAAAGYSQVGRSKVSVLMEALYERNPYGNFDGLCAKAVPQNELTGPNEIGIEDFLKGADIVIEAIDQGRVKWEVRREMSTHPPGATVVMTTDTTVPFVAFEGSGYQTSFFNRHHSNSEVVMYSKPPTNTVEALRSVIKTVEGDIPPDHCVPIILLRLGIIPFISQHPASAMMSASIAVQGLTDADRYRGKNLSASDLPDGFAVTYTDEQQAAIKAIFKNLFN